MHDDSVMVAIDAALASSALCDCGDSLTITSGDDAIWLECVRRREPSRLPAPIASIVRDLLHDRRFVIDLTAAA
jgi:hypothetical protein